MILAHAEAVKNIKNAAANKTVINRTSFVLQDVRLEQFK